MKYKKRCKICRKKYIPIKYATSIQHLIPHYSYIKISFLSCEKCPSCAQKCFDEIIDKRPDCIDEKDYDPDDVDFGIIECFGNWENDLDDSDYGDIGGYIFF